MASEKMHAGEDQRKEVELGARVRCKAESYHREVQKLGSELVAMKAIQIEKMCSSIPTYVTALATYYISESSSGTLVLES